MLSSILRGLARGFLRADAGFERLQEMAHGMVGGFFSAALSPEEQSAVSVRVYERTFRKATRRDLAAWEKRWFARRLPAPPAQVLVGAAGQGPEVIHLVSLGYRVDALEPSQAGARASTVAGAGTVCAARYEDLGRAVFDRSAGPAESLAGRRYDAIVLGWGSLSHVLRARDRARLLHACDRLAPCGPILASFLELSDGNIPAGRGRAAGSAAGRVVGRARGFSRESIEEAAGAHFGYWFGFCQVLSRKEIDALGRQVGRRVIWDNDDGSGYPHVTFEHTAGPAGP